MVIDGALTLVDPIGPDISGAQVSITAGFVPSEDVLSVTNQSGITGSYNASTGILTLSGTAQYAHFFSSGTWNDYANTGPSIQGYVCEYGGMAGDPTPVLSGTKDVGVSACETGCSVCSSATTCTTCDNGLTLSNGNCIGTVPTLSEWGMLIFTAIMAGTAFLSLRRQQRLV